MFTYIPNYNMKASDRKVDRLLSGLLDLKLQNTQSNNESNQQEVKRKSKKLCALRVNYDNQIYENFMEIVQKKTASDKALILKSLKNHFTFTNLIQDKQLRQLLLENFKLCKVLEGQYLMKQNNMASSFFILHQGKLAVEINGVVKRNVEAGQGFGQLALLYSAPRSASIKALKSSFLWFIDRETFQNAISSMITKSYKQNRAFIQKNPFFQYLTTNQKDRLASIAINQRFEKGKDICKEGQLAASMYIMKSGKVSKYKGTQFKGSILKGQSFEQYASLTKGGVRRYTIKATQDVELIALGVQDIQNSLGRSLPLIILRNEALKALKSSKLFQRLSEEYVEKAIDCFKLKGVKTGQAIAKKEDFCKNMIFFVAEGNYYITDNTKRTKIYGVQGLQEHDSKFKLDIKMKQNGKIAWTTAQQIAKSFGCSIAQAIANSQSINKMMEIQKNNKTNMIENSKNIKISDILVSKKLGEGQFGNVFLVTDKNKDNFYALKAISKEQTLSYKLEKHLINQRQALSLVSSPFIMEFIRSYKDQTYIYFLTQFINGIELFDAIRMIGLLNPKQTIFYAAQLLHIIQQLHQKNLVYRDLKPENVMVCADGYLKLIDLGTCKRLKGNEKTFTMIGTPSYMAPQTLAGKGSSFYVDLWSLGVVIFEFMAGFVPYGQDVDKPDLIYQEILKNPLKFPKHMKDPAINSFISLLLNKNPETRLSGSFNALKNHPIFENIQWHELISKKIVPPFELSQDKLLKTSQLKSKAKPLCQFLKQTNKKAFKRQGLDPRWDACF